MAARKLPVCMEIEEFKNLIKHTKKKHHKIAFLLGFGSGLRISEVLNLTKHEVDMKDRKILVKQGKGSKDRVVPLPKGFKEEFLTLLPLKEKCNIRALQTGFKRACARAGILEKKPTMHFHCVSDDTEILTVNGWKKRNELKKREKIYSYNINKDLIELDDIKKVHKYDYSGNLWNIKNTYFDCLMSDDHNALMNIANIKVINEKRISSVWNGWKLIKMKDFIKTKNKRLVKQKVSANYEGHKTIGLAKAGLLGWIITDGCIHKRKNQNSYEIVITQSWTANRKKCEIITNLLRDSGVEHSIKLQKPKVNSFNPEGQIMRFRLSSKFENIKWIFDWINENKIPKHKIFQLKKEELEQIFKMMMLADGCRNNEYCSQNKQMISFLQTLCIFIKKRCLLSKGFHNKSGKEKCRTWITDREDTNILKNEVSQKFYNGIIWCPETCNNTWIARRNGKVFFTGNSLRHGFATHLISQGMPIHHVRTLMGHTNIATTNIYLIANPKDALKSYEDLF